MKFIDKLFSEESVAWKDWLLCDVASFDTPSTRIHSYLWKIITDELNTYRCITVVNVFNGASTSFWFDHWLSGGPLCSSHAALFSHTTRQNVSVQYVFQNGFELCLRPRLTNVASAKLDNLVSCLQEYRLGEGFDSRTLRMTDKPYTTRDAYTMLDYTHGSTDVHERRIWGTRAPNKVKIFTWLYFKDKLSTRANLHSKHVVDDDHCQRYSASLEDRHHVFFTCAELWFKIGLPNTASLFDDEIWNPSTPPSLDASIWPFVLLTKLWQLWDARNGEIFRNELYSRCTVISRVCDDLVVWRKRLKANHVYNFDD
jgi:hypothetical protein